MEFIKNAQLSLEDVIVVGAFDNNIYVSDKNIRNFCEEYLNEELIKNGEIKELYTFGKLENKLVYIIGLGDENTYNISKLIKALGKVKYKNNTAIFLDSFIANLDYEEAFKEAIIAIVEYNYRYDECKSKKSDEVSVKLIANKINDDLLQKAFNISCGINNTKDLVNKPYNYLNTNQLVEYVLNLEKELNSSKVSVKVFDKPEIEKMKMNAFLGVNKGSDVDAKLIYLKYQGKAEYNNPIALVGKGLMFDTGGYSLKSNMCEMKTDMAGAATVLGVFEAIVKNDVQENVMLIIAATDNKINSGALLPDDVVTAMNGKTIEIVSTDAEGRLTLADAVYFAQLEGAKEVIDVATLTGACVVALGEEVVGVFTNNQVKVNDFLECAKSSYELAWQLPITEGIKNKVRSSKVADLTNSTGRMMGASGAAAFILEFINEGVDWIHLDIAGPAFSTSPSNGKEYGATGIMVRTIYNYLQNRSKSV